MDKTFYRILTEAQERIRDPAQWCRGAYARDAHGNAVSLRSPEAVCWCGSAALILSSTREVTYSPKMAALLEPSRADHEDDATRIRAGIVATNDDRGHAEVMAFYDAARERARRLEAQAA